MAAFLMILVYLFVILFTIYFLITILRFMRDKINLDKEKNEKLDELIKVINKKIDNN